MNLYYIDDIKISIMCMNIIKDKINFTNTLCSAMNFLFFVNMCNSLRLASYGFLYTTRKLKEIIKL